MTKETKNIPEIVEDVAKKQGFDVGGALTFSEFIELIQKMKKDTDNGKNWDKSEKSFGDFYQEKYRRKKK